MTTYVNIPLACVRLHEAGTRITKLGYSSPGMRHGIYGCMHGCAEDAGEMLPCSGSEDDRGQLAECLAFISDMALTGDAEGGHRVDPGSGPGTCLPQTSAAPGDSEESREATGEQVDEEEQAVPEPTNVCGPGTGGRMTRTRWMRHRLERLRLQRQRSAPGVATHSASVDDPVSSHLQMLNSLDIQVRHCCRLPTAPRGKDHALKLMTDF